MTVSTLDNNVVYTGNGSTTEFAVPFKVLDAAHLVVTRLIAATGAEDHVYVGTDYSYTGIGDDAGTLTLIGTALSSTYKLLIERIVPYTQELDLINAGGFYPETVETQLDLMIMGVQQIASETDDVATRALLVPFGETAPSYADFANSFKGDPGGNIMACGPFTAISGLIIPTGCDVIYTSEYRAGSRKGGGRYLRWVAPLAALPAIATISGITENAWWATSADGARWYPDPTVLHFDQFGCYRNCVVTAQGEITSGSDDYPAHLAMLSCLNWSAVTNPMFSIYRSLPPVQYAGGLYYSSKTLQFKIGTFWQIAPPTATGLNGASWFFPANTTGAMVHHYNTSALDSGTSAYSALGSRFENILLNGTSGVAAAADGWRIWAACSLIECEGMNFNRHGAYIYADVGGVNGVNLGNANGSKIIGGHYQRNGSLTFQGNGVVLQGGDANACVLEGIDSSANFDYGFDDLSFLGNTLMGLHTSSNGTPNSGGTRYSVRQAYSMCSYGGNLYAAVPSQDTACETTVPGTNANVWSLIDAGSTDILHPLWTTAQSGKWRAGGGYHHTGAGNNLTVLLGCYSEGDQSKAWLGPRNLALNCYFTSGWNSGSIISVTNSGLDLAPGVNSLTFAVMPTNAVNDAAAAAAGVPLKQIYRNGSALNVRVA